MNTNIEIYKAQLDEFELDLKDGIKEITTDLGTFELLYPYEKKRMSQCWIAVYKINNKWHTTTFGDIYNKLIELINIGKNQLMVKN